MENVRALRVACRNGDVRMIRKRIVVIGCSALTVGNVSVELRELYIQHSGLDSVESRIHANAVVVIAHLHAVVRNHAKFLGKRIIIGKHRTSVAVATEVLRREKARGPYMPNRSGLLARAIAEGVVGANGLTVILYHIQVVLVGNGHDRFHIGTLTKEMHGHNGFRFGRNRFFQCNGIDVVRAGQCVDQHRCQLQ